MRNRKAVAPTGADSEADAACPCCGAFKFPHEEFCRECLEYREIRTRQRQARKRAERWGNIWGRE